MFGEFGDEKREKKFDWSYKFYCGTCFLPCEKCMGGCGYIELKYPYYSQLYYKYIKDQLTEYCTDCMVHYVKKICPKCTLSQMSWMHIATV